MTSFILYTASRFLLIITMIFSFWVLFRGHNAPGGGFIAGLIASSAFALYLIANGPRKLRYLLKINLLLLLAAGLAVTVVSGLVAIIFSEPFLTGIWVTITFLHIRVGTPLLFDVGIYLVVVSSV